MTHAKALEAIHTLSSLATDIAPTVPPFSYSDQIPMTPYNAAPALVVWLYLVTNPQFLQILDTAPDYDFVLPPGQPRIVVNTVQEIATATNLTVPAVGAILDSYRKPDPTLQSQFDVKQTFRNVAKTFQSFAASSLYPRTNCPGDGTAMLNLAENGATVDPQATSFPA
ncbi:hypothetical protein HDF16_003587 [Granulicella aggregans]|uniref:Uncharacterized protein n=1 Tax=Granulicella aggregans TaxID=474949 RepID=A0A7W8E531_9BACT|nr:hypothetical protein [Granulicella aggregans]MBB5058864.1 hypothetical protein [Granulicella aggregans]